MADAAHAKGFHLGQLARIKDEALGLDPFVEVLELVARVFWCVEGDDDRRLDRRRQKAAQAQCGHAIQQGLAVVRVALMAGGQAAFFGVLQQGFMQGGDHVGRWGEAPLAGLDHISVLVEQIHRQGMTIALGRGQRGFFCEDKPHARYAFQAFAGGGDQRLERDFAGIDRQRAERTHGVDDQALAVVFDHLGDLRQRVENAGTGFAMDQRDVGDSRVSLQ